MKFSLLFLSIPLFAQTTIQIDVGGPPTGTYASDTVCGGANYAVSGQAGIYSTLKYGTAFSCDVPAPNGSCVATLDLIENRLAGSDPSTQSGIGTRVFTASVQGVASAPIDIFAAVGALKPYQLSLAPVNVTDGHLRFTFAASKGNAVLSGLDISCIPTPPPPAGVSCASLAPTTGVVLAITMPDGSCLPVTMIAPPGYIPNNFQAVWSNQSTPGTLSIQSFYSTLTPTPAQ